MILFVAFLGIFYLTTLRQGEAWGDDFAMYIMQARNIASGDWSPPSGYVYNPHFPRVGPRAYPPLFPLLLSPLYRIWGLNLTPMKVEVVLFFLAGLYAAFEFLSRQTAFPYAAGIVALVGLSPYFWDFKETVVSDLPFFFFSFLTLGVISACDRGDWQSTLGACAASLCVYLCFATRAAGVVFIPCLLFAGLSRRKALLAAAIAVFLIGLHSLLFRSLGGYVNQLGGLWHALPGNLLAYSWSVRHRVFGLGSNAFSWIFLLALVALGGTGLIQRLKRGPAVGEVFTICYAALILLWSADADVRFLIPLLPMWLFYVTVAIRRLPRRAEMIAAGVLVAVALGGYVSRFSTMDYGPIREGMGNPAFASICNYIRSQTPENAVLVYDRPRLLTLVSGRRVSAYHEPADQQDLWNYFSGISAGYVLIDRQYPDDSGYLEPLLLRKQAREVFAEGSFHLYVISAS